MRTNIDALHGLVFAEAAAALFARVLGKSKAHAVLDRLSQRSAAERRPLLDLALQARAADVALADGVGEADLREAFDVDRAARRAGALARPRLAARPGAPG